MDKSHSQARTARTALLVDIRQRLIAPARALIEYSDLIADNVTELPHQELQADINRIGSAARQLYELVDKSLVDGVSITNANAAEDEFERRLRHELRTPINGIIGYGEMIADDLEELGATHLTSDLISLLSEARNLLGRLDKIVDFSRDTETLLSDNLESHLQPAMIDLAQSIQTAGSDDQQPQVGRILVVDDIETNRDLLERRLVQDGHTVTKVGDGLSALAALREHDFDLVLLDLMMPGMNGFDVLQQMKAEPSLRNIPVIVISALEESDSAIGCIEAGAHDYLPKPFNPKLLRARIRSGLENKTWVDDEREQRKFIQQAFSKFISPVVVEQLIANPDKLVLGGERTEISSVFTDLTGFTPLIETSEPAEVLPVLNRYFDGMCRIVLKHEGTIDKIVGDALHAFFGAPLKQNDHPLKAVSCAIELDRYAKAFVLDDDARRLQFGHTRIGVHTGTGVVGNFGGDAFFDYTAYGDVVNTAARMESVNKVLGTTICITGDSAKRCRGIVFRPVGRLMLKGKNVAMDGFEPLYESSITVCPVDLYMDAYNLMRSESGEAAKAFADLADKYPIDPLVTLHAKRLREGQVGVVVLATD